jgi:parvulin-like peptidyl-prolyl isomerase
MKKAMVYFCITSLSIFACTKKDPGLKLQAGTPAYELATALQEKVPYVAPEQNNPLVTCKTFTTTTGEVIHHLQTHFADRLDMLKAMPDAKIKEIIKQNGTQLATRRLLLDAAQNAEIIIPQADLDSVWKTHTARFENIEKYKEALEKQGSSLEMVESEMKQKLTIERFLETALGNLAPVTEMDIVREYQKDKTATVRHILLTTEGKNDQEVEEIRRKAEKIVAEARAGADFEELVKEHSEDPGSKSKGGLYANFQRGRMVKSFEDAAFSVPVGEISDVVETQYGFHIIKVIERKKETQPLQEMRSLIKNRLQKQNKNAAQEAMMARLKDSENFKVIAF